MPAPDTASLDHCARMVAKIRDEIDLAGGRLRFDRYMDLALNAPALGYYRAPLHRFGAGGDFVTAPELSPLFARCVARQVAEILDLTGAFEVCEAGAGSGRLCVQLLAALAPLGYERVHYCILEPSADLRARQRELLEAEAPGALDRVRWLDGLPGEGFRGVIIANELLDALPVRRFRSTDTGILEAYVEWRDHRLGWRFDAPDDERLAQAVDEIQGILGRSFPQGYTSELGFQRSAWVRSAGASLSRGAMLIFDYGYPLAEYYHPQRTEGTLKCFFRHFAHDDPFLYPGIQDISAHVEFSSLADAADEAGLDLGGFTNQAEFLLATGLLDQCRDFDPLADDYASLTGQIKRLTLPGEMGELVKVIGLTRGMRAGLSGFSGRDLRDRL